MTQQRLKHLHLGVNGFWVAGALEHLKRIFKDFKGQLFMKPPPL